jgi:tyrosine-specific transport protein
MPNKNFYKALATLVGTIIGVGIFTIPFAVIKSGLLPFLILLPLLVYVQRLFHVYYMEIIIATGEKHRLPGYVEEFFGPRAKKLSLGLVLAAVYGSLLAYIITGGLFAYELLSPMLGGNLYIYTLILFAIQSIIVLYGLKMIARVESWLATLMIGAVILIFFKTAAFFSPDNFTAMNWHYFLLPYGPIFFAVGGDAAIPEVCRLLKGERAQIKKVIKWSAYITLVITGLFALAIVGATGALTSPDTLAGLKAIFGSGFISIALLLGLLAVITSFITFAEATKEIFFWDLKISKTKSWLLALAPPLLFYLFGAHNLTQVVAITGSVSGGLIGIIFVWLFYRAKRSPQGVLIESKINKTTAWALSIFFIIGFIYSLYFLGK